MKSIGFQRRRRMVGLVPVAALAAFLGFQAVAYACVPSSQTNLSSATAEPGDTIQAGASALSSANTAYRLRLASSAAGVASGLVLGGDANTDGGGNIAMVSRIVPTNATSGVKWVAWVNRANSADRSPSRALTVL
ncbi:MAG: hypothetical protein LC733_11965 [Actinobacteria bacterium]|nr:hypothetical protein [Actinomycetota bacterium]